MCSDASGCHAVPEASRVHRIGPKRALHRHLPVIHLRRAHLKMVHLGMIDRLGGAGLRGHWRCVMPAMIRGHGRAVARRMACARRRRFGLRRRLCRRLRGDRLLGRPSLGGGLLLAERLLFFVVGLSGIGVVMPGMCWCCATAGADTAASASALAAANNFIVTESLLRSGFGRGISGVSWRRRCDFAHVTVIECRKEIHRRRARKRPASETGAERLDRQPDENGNAAAVAIRLFAMAGRR